MQTARQYNSCKNSCKNLQKLNTSSVILQKCKCKYKTKHANITTKNLQIQVGVMETIIVFIKTTTKGSKSLLQVAKT